MAASDTRTSPSPDASLPRQIWRRWQQATRAIGVVQTRVIMLLIYVVLVLPIGLLFRTRRDALHLKPRKSNWVECKEEEQNVERARRQS